MLKDLFLSIATVRPGMKLPSPKKQKRPASLEGSENIFPIEERIKCSTLSRRPRKDSDSKRPKRKKSECLLDTLELPREIRKEAKNSAVVNNTKSDPLNILVVGARNVGKSALTVRFITRRYIGEYMSGENQTYNYVADEKHQQPVVFLDESNELEDNCFMESQLSEENLAWADGIMLVYDVGAVDTFSYAKNVINLMNNQFSATNDKADLNHCDTTSHLPKNSANFWKTKIASNFKPILLLGNKTDLVKRRSVSEDDVREAAEEFPPWVTCQELSAAEGYDKVVDCVNELISNIREKRKVLCGLSPKPNFKHMVGNVFRNRSM